MSKRFFWYVTPAAACCVYVRVLTASGREREAKIENRTIFCTCLQTVLLPVMKNCLSAKYVRLEEFLRLPRVIFIADLSYFGMILLTTCRITPPSLQRRWIISCIMNASARPSRFVGHTHYMLYKAPFLLTRTEGERAGRWIQYLNVIISSPPPKKKYVCLTAAPSLLVCCYKNNICVRLSCLVIPLNGAGDATFYVPEFKKGMDQNTIPSPWGGGGGAE